MKSQQERPVADIDDHENESLPGLGMAREAIGNALSLVNPLPHGAQAAAALAHELLDDELFDDEAAAPSPGF